MKLFEHLASLWPGLSAREIFLEPWTTHLSLYGWIALLGFLVTLCCGVLGTFLVLRRMALIGDAISHSVLPGIALTFLLWQTRNSLYMMVGALLSGLLATVLIETIHRKSRLKADSAMGITFTSLFALGVILITTSADQVDLDPDCVLYGQIDFVPFAPFLSWAGVEILPWPVVIMGLVTLGTLGLIALFYKELLLSSFDPGLAAAAGIAPNLVHYLLMAALSLVVVSAFESVGVILVIAMLILPGATGLLLQRRLPGVLLIAALHALLSSVLGLHLAIALDCSIAAAMVVVGGIIFVLAWIFSKK